MMEKIHLKTQIEVRFANILLFRDFYRPLVKKYQEEIKLFINNAGQEYNEGVQMIFDEKGFAIDLRWDRVIFVTYQWPSNMLSTSGPLFDFLEIVKNIEKETNLIALILAEWNLLPIDRSENEYAAKDFLGREIKRLLPHSNKINEEDAIVQVNYKGDECSMKVNYGPFRRDRDLKQMEAMSIPFTLPQMEVKDLKGVMTYITISEKIKHLKIDQIKMLNKDVDNILKSLSETHETQ